MQETPEQEKESLIKDAALGNIVQALVKNLERRLDAEEKIVAQLVLAIQEMWATTEAIVRTIVSGLNEEEQGKFVELMAELRKQAMQNMQEVIDNLAPDIEQSDEPSTGVATDEPTPDQGPSGG